MYVIDYALGGAGQRVLEKVPPSQAERLRSCAMDELAPAKYEDTEVAVLWGLDSYSGIDLKIKNKLKEPITVLWSEGSVGYHSYQEPLVCTSTTSSVAHIGSCGPIAREQMPAQTTIEPNKELGFSALPRSHVRWRDFSDPSTGGFWQPVKNIFGISANTTQDAEERDKLANTVVGKQLNISLPIEIHGQKVTYLFTLVVNKAAVRTYGWSTSPWIEEC